MIPLLHVIVHIRVSKSRTRMNLYGRISGLPGQNYSSVKRYNSPAGNQNYDLCEKWIYFTCAKIRHTQRGKNRVLPANW